MADDEHASSPIHLKVDTSSLVMVTVLQVTTGVRAIDDIDSRLKQHLLRGLPALWWSENFPCPCAFLLFEHVT